jgi:hypothetical protein
MQYIKQIHQQDHKTNNYPTEWPSRDRQYIVSASHLRLANWCLTLKCPQKLLCFESLSFSGHQDGIRLLAQNTGCLQWRWRVMSGQTGGALLCRFGFLCRVSACSCVTKETGWYSAQVCTNCPPFTFTSAYHPNFTFIKLVCNSIQPTELLHRHDFQHEARWNCFCCWCKFLVL